MQESEGFVNLFVTLGRNPILGILAGTFVTAVIQSSSASVGILQSLAAAGLVPFNAAIYIIMGQNIGTCVTAILSSLGAKKNAKTAALMHLLFNVMGTVLFSVVAIVYFQVLNPMAGTGTITQTQISTVHTFFNICLLYTSISKLTQILQMDEGYGDGAAKLLLAQSYEKSGDKDQANALYQKLVEDYKDTDIATSAQAALDAQNAKEDE